MGCSLQFDPKSDCPGNAMGIPYSTLRIGFEYCVRGPLVLIVRNSITIAIRVARAATCGSGILKAGRGQPPSPVADDPRADCGRSLSGHRSTE